MSWETTAFDTGTLSMLAGTPRQPTWLAVCDSTVGVRFSENYAEVDFPVNICQKSGTPFLARDATFELSTDGLIVADGTTLAVHRCADPVNAPSTWTEVGFAGTAAAQKARCVAALQSARMLVVTGGDGLWRKFSTWSHPVTSATAFASTTRPYRRCVTYCGTGGAAVFYDPDVGVYKSVDFGATWFLAWSHTGGGDNAWLANGPSATTLYLGDGTTVWRLPGTTDLSGTKTWDNAQLGTPVDTGKNGLFGCSDGRGDICIIEASTQKIWRSQTHGSNPVETWVDEDDGNLTEFDGGLTNVAMSDDGFIYAADPTFVIRGSFESKRTAVTVTPETASVSAPATVQMTVTLDPAAPVGGQKVWFDTTDSRRADVQGSVILAEAATQAVVNISTGPYEGSAVVTAVTRPDSLSNPEEPNAAGVNFAALGLTGGVPIEELGTSTYQGRQGGLYGAGSNSVPTTNTYRARGLAAAAGVVKRDVDGNPDTNGKILFGSMCFSNPLHEYDDWKQRYPASNTAIKRITGSQSGQDIVAWTTPFPTAPAAAPAAPATGSVPWDTFINRVRAQGTDKQLQVMWCQFAVQNPQGLIPGQSLDDLEDLMLPMMEDIRDYLQATFVNLKQIFVTGRTYGGYHSLALTGTGNPEPYAYQGWFIAREWVLGSVNDASKTWTGWGPVWWGNGTTPRAADGAKWLVDHFWEGTHESVSGLLKTSRYLEAFFRGGSEFTTWYS